MTEQRNLLNDLRIDREQAPRPAGRGALIIASAVTMALLLAITYYLGSTSRGEQANSTADQLAPQGTIANANAAPASTPVGAAATTDGSVLSASGYITARRMATVASRITGLIEEVVVEEGMLVKSGDVLARLNDDLVNVDLNLAEAQARAAAAEIGSVSASLDEAKRVLRRVSALKSTDYSSEAALTEARANVERLTATLTRTRADLEVARQQVARQQEQLGEHVIRAPFAGVVTDKNAQPGEVVSPMSAGGGFTRTGICTIVDMDSLEIEVDVNEAFIGRVSAGQTVTANLDAYPEWDIPARVIAIIPTANRDKATVRVRIGIDTRDPRILPDMGVKVAFLKTAA